MNKFQKISIAKEARIELHDALNLTGAEISINKMPADTSVPFIHSHKQNEEIYGILKGHGTILLDGEEMELKAGDWLRVSPAVKRQLSTTPDSAMTYLCIQVKSNSLEQWTMTDAIV